MSHLSHPQLAARGIAVAARRLEKENLDPLQCTASEAIMTLCYHPGPIGEWATLCTDVDFRMWCRMWKTYQFLRKRELRRE